MSDTRGANSRSGSGPLLDGVPNFRTLAGIPAADGRHVRDGVIFRSEALSALSPSAKRVLESLGIRLVCDLRSPAEQEKNPMEWAGPLPRVLAMDVLPDAQVAGADLISRIMADPTGGVARQVLLDNARDMPSAFAASTRRLFDAILDDDGLPLLVACQAGKDRTGYVVSILLLALGASEEEIVAEFMRSADHIDPRRVHAAMLGWLPEPPERMLSERTLHSVSVLPEYVHAALEALLVLYGSYAEFLREACGLTAPRLERLRDLILTPRRSVPTI